MLTFCFDDMSSPNVLGYPNLAKKNLGPDDFDNTYPRAIPCRLFVYFKRHGINVSQCFVTDAPRGAWYPIAVGWFDFECDYISLLPQLTFDRVKSGDIKILFYYHEGDNPAHIKSRIDSLVKQHALPENCYFFVSANSSAEHLSRFIFFPDHEFFFHYLNRRQNTESINLGSRPYHFTALNRSHKWWRASVMADLQRSNLLTESLWSYNTTIDTGDQEQDNPLELDIDPTWRKDVKDFISQGPYFCDTLNAGSHNDHRSVTTSLYTQSYCHLILKFGQPFIMIGPPGTLKILRDHGYRVFDQVIDNRYDEITNNTQRWLAVKNTIAKLKQLDLHQWYLACYPDIKHNQEHFLNGNGEILHRLVLKLTKHSDIV